MNAPTAPEAPAPRWTISGDQTTDILANRFWEKALDAIRPLELHDRCEQILHQIIQQGAERMAEQGRTGATDILQAEEHVTKLIGLLRAQAIRLGHPKWLGEDTLQAVTDGARLQARFELWPFWPW
jgi:hypothetical protein